MPTATRFPVRPFSEEFTQARQSIQEYFAFAREVAARVRLQLERQNRQKTCTASADGKFRNAKRVISQVAEEYSVKQAFVNQAKLCAQEFSEDWVEGFLAQCETSEYLPARQTFIALSSVPAADRPIYVELLLERKWTAKQIMQNRIQDYGKSSHGGKAPSSPRSLAEAMEQLHRTEARLTAIEEAITPEAGSRRDRSRRSAVVNALATAREAMASARDALAG